MRLLDARVDISNLDTRPGSCPAASRGPGIRRIDDLVALAQVGIVKACCDPALCTIGAAAIVASDVPLSWTATALSETSVLARNLCSGGICSQPPL